MPNHCVFIKTWLNDLPWLRYCLESINKFYNPAPVILIADQNCKETLDSWNLPESITTHYIPNPINGYIAQQRYKLQAHHYTEADYILYIDSDTVFTRPTTINDFVVNGRIQLIIESYERLGTTVPWKAITEKYMGVPVAFEFMRRFPIVHHRQTLLDIETAFPDLQEQLKQLKNRAFSEFNLMGALAYEIVSPHYNFNIYPHTPLPEKCAEQFWSWGGLKPSIEKEIQCILGKE